MSTSWGLAAVDFDFVLRRCVPYVFGSQLLDLDVARVERMTAVASRLSERLPAEVSNYDDDNPENRDAWNDALSFGGMEHHRPFFLLEGEAGKVNAWLDRFMASTPETCLDIVDDQFRARFPDWAQVIGHPSVWPESPWQRPPHYPSPVTAGLDVMRVAWAALQRGETEFHCAHQDDPDGEPRIEEVDRFLDSMLFGAVIGYAVARAPAVWGSGGWVMPTAMLEYAELSAELFRKPRDVFRPHLPPGCLMADDVSHFTSGRLTDGCDGEIGGIVLPADVKTVRRQLADAQVRLTDPEIGTRAAMKHLQGEGLLQALIEGIFQGADRGKSGPLSLPQSNEVERERTEAREFAEGLVYENIPTFRLFDECFAYAEAHGLAVVEISSQGVPWPVGVA